MSNKEGKWTHFSFVFSSAEAVLAFTNTILALIVLCVFSIFTYFRSLTDMRWVNSLVHNTDVHQVLVSRAEQQKHSKDVSKPHIIGSKNEKRTSAHICVFPAADVETSAQNTHPGTQLRPGGKATVHRKTFTEGHLCCLQGGLGWGRMRAGANQSLAPSEHRKGLQALPALIGSIMTLHQTYLMVTTGNILFAQRKVVKYDSRRTLQREISRVQV